MSYRTLRKWAIHFAKNPPGDDLRIAYPIAQLCAITANMHRDPKKRSQPWTPEDFMLTKQIEKTQARKTMRGTSPETTAFLFAMAGVPVPKDEDPVDAMLALNPPPHIRAKYGGKPQ